MRGCGTMFCRVVVPQRVTLPSLKFEQAVICPDGPSPATGEGNGKGANAAAGYLWSASVRSTDLDFSSQKNLNLSRRIFHTSSKSIRGRLLSYLSFQASKAGSRDFCIPFNRQQMADYLNLDRSALSKELGLMQEEGILSFYKNEFELLEAEEYDVKR